MNKYLLTISLLLVFGTSAYMSIYGLTAVFTGMVVVVLCMGAGMEIGKILAVVHLHRSWREIGWFPRVFYIVVIGVLSAITSCELIGFLAQRHAGSTREAATIEARLSELDKEAEILRSHIAIIDQTLAGLPSGYVTKRFREREAAGYDRMRDRQLEIVREASELKASKIANPGFSAPIFAASRIFGLNPEKTVSMFVLILVTVLEPLSIGLAVATNSAWQKANRAPEKMRIARKTAQKRQTVAGAAKKPAQAANPYTIELREIAKRHNLKIKDIAKITDRKQSETVEGWLEERPIIPIKALRLLRRWSLKQPAILLINSGEDGNQKILNRSLKTKSMV